MQVIRLCTVAALNLLQVPAIIEAVRVLKEYDRRATRLELSEIARVRYECELSAGAVTRLHLF